MATSLELLIKARQETDAAFKAVIKNMADAETAAKKYNAALKEAGDQIKGSLAQAAEGLSSKLGPLGSAMSALGPAGTAAAVGVAAVVAAVGAAVKVSVDAAMAAADYADKMAGLADKTGLTFTALQNLDVAAKLGNSSLEAVSGAVNKMQLAMAKGSDGFRQLGLSIADLKKMSPTEQFAEVSKALLNVTDQTERAEVGSKLFGKSWGDLIGTMKAAASGASELGGALSEEAGAAAAELKDKTDLMAEAWDRVQRQFGAAIAQSPEVQDGIDAITSALVAMAEKIGEWAPTIGRLFTGIKFHIQTLMAEIQLVTRAATGDGIAAWRDYKSKIESLELEKLFADVKGGGSTNKPKTTIGPSDADIAKAAAGYKKVADEARKLAEEENKLREKTALAWDAFFKTLSKEESDLTDWVRKEAQARQDARVKGILAEYEASVRATEKRKEDEKKALEDARKLWEQNTAAIFQAASAADQFGDMIGGALGAAISGAGALLSAFGSVRVGLDQIKNAGSGLGGILDKAMGGLGIAGSVLSVGKGIFDSLFGGAKKAREEMEKLRGEFIKGSGGMVALSAHAKAAGVSLDGMFKQKSATALAAQIDIIKGKLADWDEAQKILTDGMQKWGIAVGDMGPKFAGLELDKRAHEMVMFFAAASGVGANLDAVTAGMAKDVNDLVAQYQAAGLAIPAALRPVLEAMLKNGDLVDENGAAYESLEAAGITFAETMEGALSKIGDEINKLMQVLARGFNIPINFEVSGSPSAPSGGGGGGGHHAPQDDPPGFASGGVGNFGAGTSAVLHGPEAILPLDDRTLGRLGGMIAQAMSAGGGGGSAGITVNVPVNIGNRQMGSVLAHVSRTRQGRISPAGIRKF